MYAKLTAEASTWSQDKKAWSGGGGGGLVCAGDNDRKKVWAKDWRSFRGSSNADAMGWASCATLDIMRSSQDDDELCLAKPARPNSALQLLCHRRRAFGMPTDHTSTLFHDGEQYELTEDGRVPPFTPARTPQYKDGSSIDWLHEEAAERERDHALHSQAGVRGALLPAIESARMWVVVIVTGMGIGMAGAWLDVLVKWSFSYIFFFYVSAELNVRLGDLREGRCSYGFFYNSVACCSGLDRKCSIV